MAPANTTEQKKTAIKEKKEIQDGLSNSDYRWLLELPDELDVLISHRDFGQAITHIERARQIISACVGETPKLQSLRSSLDERITAISRLVSIDLTSPGATKSQIQEDIQRLLRLGLGDQARDIYLSARTTHIRHKLRQLQFNGDIVAFMFDYSDVFFKLIKNTCEWFSVSFHDPSMASGFMKWIQKELNYYAKTFKKQTFAMKHEFSVLVKCVVATLDGCQELNEIGLDLSSIFEHLINDDLVAAIEEHSRKCDDEIFNCIHSDKFERLAPDNELFDASDLQFSIVF